MAGDNNRLYFKNYERRPDDEEFAEVMKILKEEGAIISDKYISNPEILRNIDKLVDITKYKEGMRIYHKKFGEGIIQKIEAEGDDYKLDIQFDKSGHKRLMAKFANLEII